MEMLYIHWNNIANLSIGFRILIAFIRSPQTNHTITATRFILGKFKVNTMICSLLSFKTKQKNYLFIPNKSLMGTQFLYGNTRFLVIKNIKVIVNFKTLQRLENATVFITTQIMFAANSFIFTLPGKVFLKIVKLKILLPFHELVNREDTVESKCTKRFFPFEAIYRYPDVYLAFPPINSVGTAKAFV